MSTYNSRYILSRKHNCYKTGYTQSGPLYYTEISLDVITGLTRTCLVYVPYVRMYARRSTRNQRQLEAGSGGIVIHRTLYSDSQSAWMPKSFAAVEPRRHCNPTSVSVCPQQWCCGDDSCVVNIPRVLRLSVSFLLLLLRRETQFNDAQWSILRRCFVVAIVDGTYRVHRSTESSLYSLCTVVLPLLNERSLSIERSSITIEFSMSMTDRRSTRIRVRCMTNSERLPRCTDVDSSFVPCRVRRYSSFSTLPYKLNFLLSWKFSADRCGIRDAEVKTWRDFCKNQFRIHRAFSIIETCASVVRTLIQLYLCIKRDCKLFR